MPWDFGTFIILSWGLSSVVSLIAIFEAAKDRKLTLSEIAASFYNAFTATFAFAVLAATFGAPTQSLLAGTIIDMAKSQFMLALPTSTLLSILIACIVGFTGFYAYMTVRGIGLTAAATTLILLTVAVASIASMGLQATANLLLASLLAGALGALTAIAVSEAWTR